MEEGAEDEVGRALRGGNRTDYIRVLDLVSTKCTYSVVETLELAHLVHQESVEILILPSRVVPQLKPFP